MPVPAITASEKDNAIFDKWEAEVASSAGVALINIGAMSVDDVLNEKVVLSVIPANELPALSSKAVASIWI